MTKNEWLNIINKIDEKYIGELADHQIKNQVSKKSSKEDVVTLKPEYIRSEPSRFPFKKAAIAAAAVVCVAAAGIFMRVNNKPRTVSPNDSTSVSSDMIISGETSETSLLPVPENLILDLELPENTPSELPQIKLTLRKWDKDFMEKTLLDGKAIAERQDNECQHYPGEKLYNYNTEDQISVFFEPGRFGYDDEKALGCEFAYDKLYYRGTYDFMASGEELSAFSRENAVTRVNEFLDRLGIENYGKPKIAPIKADYANKVLDVFKGRVDKNGVVFDYTPWTADEEIYILRYPLIYGTAELTEDDLAGSQSPGTIGGSYIDAMVSKDKVLKVYGNGIYSEEYEITNKIRVNCNSDQALEKLKKYYSGLTLDDPINYYKCKLVYVPGDETGDHMTVNYTPAWVFYGYSAQDGIINKYQENQYFYADTGFRYIDR